MSDFKYPEPNPDKKHPVQIWTERYASENYLFGREPVNTLKSFHPYLKKGKALDVAMGEGRNAVYLAQQGFTVEGVDGVTSAVEKARKLAEEKKVALEAKVQNLDFFLMPLMKYDTIVMTYYRPQARFFSEIRRGLVLGGTFLLEAYTVEHLKRGAPPNPLIDFDQCYKPGEVVSLLKDLQIVYYRELPDPDGCTVQAIARKSAV